jgi:flagellar motor switch protein FliG
VHLPKETSSAERARILLALIDQQGRKADFGALTKKAEALQSQGGARDTHDMPSRETLLRSARDLLSRLEPGKKQQTAPAPTPKPRGGMLSKAVIRSTIAALIEESDLSREHPAIIAIVLQNQSSKTKAAVLRQLPGPLARRVQQSMERVKEVC